MRYDRDIKEITDGGEIIYKPRYDTKHGKCQIKIMKGTIMFDAFQLFT